MWLLATGLAVKSPVAVKITSGAERFGANRPLWNIGGRNRSFIGGIDSDSRLWISGIDSDSDSGVK